MKRKLVLSSKNICWRQSRHYFHLTYLFLCLSAIDWWTYSLDAEAVQSPPLLEGPPLPREVLCTMPCVGTVLRIYSNRFIKEVLHMQKGIYWARFCNITCKQEFGIWKGILLATSRVRLLSHEDGSVVDRLK